MAELRVRRDDLATCEIAGNEPDHVLADGEARLLVERFALSANNITYAVLGDGLGYWRVFPAPDGWGRIPAWGYARVTASSTPAVAEGQRVLGLVPMGTHFTVRPERHPLGFVDTSPHREPLSPVYNQYLSIEDDDDAALVMRPLFVTSVLLDRLLSEAGFHGAGTVVLTSASSKTAYGLAHLLKQRPVDTIGLTSPGRSEWVASLGLYELVLSYDRVAELAADRAALVDFAGDRRIIRAVHERLGDSLAHSLLVGYTHGKPADDEAPLPGPSPAHFFAPAEIARRGRDVGRWYARAWPEFAPVARRTMRIERVRDAGGLERVYRDLLEGRAEPSTGYVASLAPDD
jgi:Protein of unknown function (DUF2855)